MNGNPFSNRYPENMSCDQIKELFVDEFVDLPSILNHNHYFIWGARGSGKSMLFKYIEACCHADSVEELKQQSLINCPIIPIYYKIATNALRMVEFVLIDQNYAALLSEHMLIMSIVRLTLNNIKNYDDVPKENKVKYVKQIVYELFGIEVDDSVLRANKLRTAEEEPLEWLSSICWYELQAVLDYLRNTNKKIDIDYRGCIVGYHDFLIPFFELTKKLVGIENLVFYLLIDEAGRTHEFQQEIINGWIACRNHDVLSIKLTSVKAEYTTFYTRDRWAIQKIHDYSETILNIVHYSKKDYKTKIKKIVQKRFAAYGIEIDDIEEFYPIDGKYQEIIDSEKNKLEKEYADCKTQETFSEYCSRRLMPRVFQYLSGKHKIPSCYSGFEMLVATSAGIIRNFLEPSEMMYNAVAEQNKGQKVMNIPASIQEEQINIYSEQFFAGIYNIPLNNKEEKDILLKLENLIRSLGNYFRARLLMKDLTEGRIFSFAIKQVEKLEYKERRVLQLAEQYDYLQKSFYSGKDGTNAEEWYLLSRKLAPFFKLDPTALKGRIVFSPLDIQIAMKNPDQFVKMKMDKLQKRKSEKENKVHQISLFDDEDAILYMEEAEGE